MITLLTTLLGALAADGAGPRGRVQELRGRIGLSGAVDTRTLMDKRLAFARERYPGVVDFIRRSLWAVVVHPGPHANDSVAGRLVVWLARKITEDGLPYREAVLAPTKYDYFSANIHDAIANDEEADEPDGDLDIESIAERLWDEEFHDWLQEDDSNRAEHDGYWTRDVEDHDCNYASVPRVNEDGYVVINEVDGFVDIRIHSRMSGWGTCIEAITIHQAANYLSDEEHEEAMSWIDSGDDLESAYDTVNNKWLYPNHDPGERPSDEMTNTLEHLKGALADSLYAMQMVSEGAVAIRSSLPTVLDWMRVNRGVDISGWSIPELLDRVFEDHRDEKVAELQAEHDQEREGLSDRPIIRRGSPVPLLGGDEDLVQFTDGSLIVDLAYTSLWAEGKSMMHCVGQRKYGHPTQVKEGSARVFSYRNPEGVPKATLAVNRNLQTIQLQGPHNGPIHDKDGAARMAWFMHRIRKEDAELRGSSSLWDSGGKTNLVDLVQLQDKLVPNSILPASGAAIQAFLVGLVRSAAEDVEQENW